MLSCIDFELFAAAACFITFTKLTLRFIDYSLFNNQIQISLIVRKPVSMVSD